MNFKYFTGIVLLLFLGALNGSLEGEDRLEMSPVGNPGSKIINMGPCYVGDSVHTKIAIRYFGDSTVYVREQSPTIIVFRSQYDDSDLQTEFRSFDPDWRRGNYPYYFDEDNPIEAPFYYYADPSYTLEPEGWFYANLHLGAAYSGTVETVDIDTFVLKAKKTKHLLDGYIDSLMFDSVYVNPTIPKTEIWRIKSTFEDNIVTDSSSYISLSPVVGTNEFRAKDYTPPPVLPRKYQTFDWEIDYNPMNTGTDSTLYYLHFYHDYGDSIKYDSVSIKLTGTGVKQELSLVESNKIFKGDTIEIGNVPTGYQVKIKGELRNTGNTNFRSISEATKKSILNEESEVLSISKKAFEGGTLAPGESADFELNLEVKDLGIFIERYEIESDILSRDIHGVPGPESTKNIYVRGVGSAPKLRLPADTIDFGNVVINEVHCPSQRDTSILISNTGNSELLIHNITLHPDKKFKVSNRSFVINPGEDSVLTVTFMASDGKFGEVESILRFHTNDLVEEKELVLKANGVPREKSRLSIPQSISALPGDLIDIPIILDNPDFDKHPVTGAKNFTTEISFDSTVLRYENRHIIGTAGEAADIEIAQINSGTIALSINNKNDYFPAVDTLILLRMRVYLGSEPGSHLVFRRGVTKFGDGLCDDVIDIEGAIINGVVSIDSLCGIDYKTYRRKDSDVVIKSVTPNPAFETIDVVFTVLRESNIRYEIVDEHGTCISSKELGKFTGGNHKISESVAVLPQGLYLLRIWSDSGGDTESIIILR